MADLDISSGVLATITVDGQELDVLSYTLQEALFEVSELVCLVTLDDGTPPEPTELVGKTATFELKSAAGGELTYTGMVVLASRVAAGDDVTDIQLVVAPPVWQLSRRTNCRMFQEQTVQDIVRTVLQEAGVLPDQQTWMLTASYKKRVYTCQYRETDLNFIMRLLSEEGIYFIWRDNQGQSKLILSDDPSGVGDVAGAFQLPYIADAGVQGSGDGVFRISQHHAVRSDKTFLRDYDYQRPSFALEGGAESTDPNAHAEEVYVYPARTNDDGVLKRYAQVLLDSLQADRERIEGEAGLLTLRPGLRFAVTDHPYSPLNQDYLVTEVRFSGHCRRGFGLVGGSIEADASDYGYNCRFTAIPTSRSPYRPPRYGVMAQIPGLQTAITSGVAGEEINTNESGEVAARFHWDRDPAHVGDRSSQNQEKTSIWMRTSQLPLGGSMLLPRKEWEVAVCYREGDPDLPLVMSRIYNAATPPPYPLPANKARMALQTATTPGGGSSNEIRMDDTKGQEQMFFNASKDMSVEVGHNITESVGVNNTIVVGSNQAVEIKDSLTTVVTANQSIDIGVNQKVGIGTMLVEDIGGKHDLTIGVNRTMMIGGDHRRTVAGASSETTGAARLDLVVGTVTDGALADMTHTVGGAYITLVNGGRSVNAGAGRTETSTVIKAIISKGGRDVTASSISSTVGGALINMVKGKRTETVDSLYTDLVAGAQLIKATNVTFEAKTLLSLVMGASTITLTPASVIIAGLSIKVDASSVDLGLVMNN